MAVYRCKMCGAQLEVSPDQKITRCSYCESVQTLPRLDDEFRTKSFERATELRMRCEFDQAALVLQGITTQFPDEAEAYWNLCLCKYGVEYVDDPKTGLKIPTCHRTHPQSILADVDYLAACEHAGVTRYKYEEEAIEIDRLQRKILEVSREERPYDIFICYKENDDITGLRTEDSVTAQDIYTELVKKGYRVFYAKITLRKRAGSEYEPYIYAALQSAKVMLVLGSRQEFFEAVWVKNEWIRYLDMMAKGDKTIIPCYEKIDPYQLPVQLRGFQALNMASKLFFTDLLDNISRIVPLPVSNAVNAPLGDGTSPVSPTHKELNMNDGVYVGEALGNRAHGHGTRFFTNGDRIEGCWNMGSCHGQATITYGDGCCWSGEWNNGRPWNGAGQYYTTPRDGNKVERLEGTIKNGQLHGEGRKYIDNRITREGYFEQGKLNGQGTSYIRGKTCTGIFKDGRPWDAIGTYGLPMNERLLYDGEWKNGQPCGQGKIECELDGVGVTIEGVFENGLNGKNTTWTFNDGRKYEGTMYDGNRTGRGVLHKPNGEWYEGEFFKGNFHGKGTYHYQQGVWTGQWQHGKEFNGNGMIFGRDDKGVFNGEFYNGYVMNGKFNGRGIYRSSDGSRFDGVFVDDRYYNGTVYDNNNRVIDTYVDGVRQSNRNLQQVQGILNFIDDIFK